MPYSLNCSGIYPSRLFWYELVSYLAQRCLPSLKYYRTKWHFGAHMELKVPETQQQCPEIITQLLKIIQRPCCEVFLEGTTFIYFFKYETTPANGITAGISERIFS